MAVNCSAISESLLESELFGYDEGAFTGARKSGKPGLFELADHGSLFLDEIREFPLPLQGKLLRVIQEQQLMHVGGSKVIRFNTRIMSATNRNLWQLVQSGNFREDLYYRLNVLELNLPPLRERSEDIFPLFFRFITERDSGEAAQLTEYRSLVEPILHTYSWPGNIRELENFVSVFRNSLEENSTAEEKLSLLKEEISFRRQRLAMYQEKISATPSAEEVRRQEISPRPENYAIRPLSRLTDEQIRNALAATGGNQSEAARLLGISRQTLWRRLRAQE